jgi:DUF2892 family protein
MLAKLFPTNLSATDRVLRIGLGVALLVLAFFGPKTAWGYLGLVPLITAFAGSCPLYSVFGISSCDSRTKMT